ncbi:PAT complex subunit CCDC47-like [Saccoglossus kowalevskii]|uniref:PAT complex subunit CCDC47 n=1 Tax=Saccoglossus kowalevskii TaxID=10224 RepID=A0ABM0MQ17_SACKO|nr:PREDICTED: coiled-coil domain-containing protein 47-like [Saccoglossus kowalevskii]
MSSYQVLLVVLLVLCTWTVQCFENQHGAEIEDNDFAEFEDLGDEDEDITIETEGEEDEIDDILDEAEFEEVEDDEITIEDEEDEFEHFQDEEEFEGFDKDLKSTKGKSEVPDLKIAKVPLHFSTNWDSYYMELMMLGGLIAYCLNFLAGKTKNHKLATAWLQTHKELLESNFSIVGDDGQAKEVQSGVLMKESENLYALWCSGRQCCEGMLVELKFIKRQDLVNVISRFMKPACDQLRITVNMNAEDMDSFVFAVANKKTASRLQKELQDISVYCPEKRSGDKYNLSSSLAVVSELGELCNGLLDSKIVNCLNSYENMFDYFHFSDQYSGAKISTDDGQPSKMPTTQKVLIFCFNVPGKGNTSVVDMCKTEPMMKLVMHCIDKVKRFRLTKEGKLKAEKSRAKVAESFLKASHSQRQEAAQTRREEKRRAEKERMMNEEDPDKQRKWEEREHRREMKKKAPKVKQMKMY